MSDAMRLNILEATIDRLDSQLAAAQAENEDIWKKANQSLKETQVEIERLRGALESVAGLDCTAYNKFILPKQCGVCISCKARAALEGKL